MRQEKKREEENKGGSKERGNREKRSNKELPAALFSRQAGTAIICTFQRVTVENEGPLTEFRTSTFEGGYFK